MKWDGERKEIMQTEFDMQIQLFEFFMTIIHKLMLALC